MNTNENTVYRRDNATQLPPPLNGTNTTAASSSSRGPILKSVAGGGLGLLIGAAATTLVHTATAQAATAEAEVEEQNIDNAGAETGLVPETVQQATGVDDSMSFNEAFAAARQEVGPGGVFEWRGNIYGTYYADEWNSMSDAERSEYYSNITGVDTNETPAADQIDPSDEHIAQTDEIPQTDIIADDDYRIDVSDNDLLEPELPEVEVLGAYYDEELDANVGAVTVDGQEVYFLDVDHNGVFDYMMADTNGDGQISADEIIDIQSDNITVDDFNDEAEPTGYVADNQAGDDGSSDEDLYADGSNNAADDVMPGYDNDADTVEFFS